MSNVKRYLVNTFSLNMLDLSNQKQIYVVTIEKLNKDAFCNELNDDNIVNAVGHQSTVDVINQLCNTSFKTNRIEIKLTDNVNVLLVFQLMVRLQEGKVLSRSEIEELLRDGKVSLLKLVVSRF